jgi:hypothetical protein
MSLLFYLLSYVPKVTITIRGKKYLTRYYLLRKDRKFFNIYLHHFHSSDPDVELHSHPWKWAWGIVLAGGYAEERKQFTFNIDKRTIVVTTHSTRPPGSIGSLTSSDFHRVDLLDEKKGSWSLFFTGPRSQEWGFLNKATGEFKNFQEFHGAIP